MAIITSHVLNGIDGTHAAGISVSLVQIGTSDPIAAAQTDESGRLALEVNPELISPNIKYELVFDTDHYWRSQGIEKRNLIAEIVLRIEVTDVDGRYHMPIIISPFSYSTWKSG